MKISKVTDYAALKKCVRPLVFSNKSILDTLKLVLVILFSASIKLSPLFQYGATNFLVCDPKKIKSRYLSSIED